MNTLLARLNAAFAFTLSVMAALTFLCFLSTLFNDNLTTVDISAGKVVVKNVPDFTTNRQKKDVASINNLGLKVNLSNVFNWNIKELFLYLTAEYKSDEYALNEVVLWDRIVMREDEQVIDMRSIIAEYYFFDEATKGKGLRGNDNVTLTLSWNVIPNAGTLPRVRGIGSKTLVFPDEYSTVARI